MRKTRKKTEQCLRAYSVLYPYLMSWGENYALFEKIRRSLGEKASMWLLKVCGELLCCFLPSLRAGSSRASAAVHSFVRLQLVRAGQAFISFYCYCLRPEIPFCCCYLGKTWKDGKEGADALR